MIDGVGMAKETVSVLIPTYNNGAILAELLEDIRWADEVLVVDSFSTDDTASICRNLGVRLIQHVYENSARQKNWAIPQCSHPWVLIVDTDERLPRELQDEIRSLLGSGIPVNTGGFRVARKTLFLGKWMKVMNLWPDYQTRLFRRDRGRYEEKEVHSDVLVQGDIGTLNTPLVHNATETLSKQVGLLDRYSSYKALEFEKQGRQFRLFDLLLRPLGAFFYLWVIRGGFTEGVRGLFVAFHTMAFSFFTYAKLWERELAQRSAPSAKAQRK
jgi:glycosyltransferase involved in cell wall biosynthesis